MHDENSEVLDQYLHKIIYVVDSWNESIYENNCLKYVFDLINTNLNFAIELNMNINCLENLNNEKNQFGVFLNNYDLLKRCFRDENYDDLLNFFNNLNHQNQQRILESLEQYILEYN